MITIIHGADIAASRKVFLDLKDKEKEALLINGQIVTLTDMVQYFEGGELFANPKSFYVEQLLSKRKKSKELSQLIEVLNSNSQENNIVLWEEKEITPAALKVFKNSTQKVFKLPQTLFQFLENIRPGNSKQLIKLFHESVQNAEVEMVFFMMVRQVRMLLGVIDQVNDPIDEVKKMAPWQKGKLQKQADAFEIKEMIKLHRDLYEIEKGIKTGTLAGSLTTTIDFLLLEI